MSAATRTKTQISLNESLAKKLRLLAAEHNVDNSTIASAALEHCFSSHHFLTKLEKQLTNKKEEIDR
ncbi:hypothetical protein B9G53_01015 [Pseudanabaena sp. SR411]|uniref:hypothetical protein n=1 Tax=Pseudanabaena sp. SR411 TaxID=1980935 RepID=UPI000B997E77|nr:hypothetical protein [Pseudanabaena sp. SR411]OYQ67563.1 hypothetical protein B9G53_01015 [Pseudanabaena sp. SR411]